LSFFQTNHYLLLTSKQQHSNRLKQLLKTYYLKLFEAFE